MSKLRKIKAPIPLLCYGVCLIGFLAMCLWHFAGNSLARANGRLAEAQMTAADFVLAGLEQQADGTLVTLDGDPQMIWENPDGRVVRTLRVEAGYSDEPREVCLYYTNRAGEDFSQDKRVFPQKQADGSYRYTLPYGAIASLRLDPCSPDVNKSIAIALGVVTMNEPAGAGSYFGPSWYQCFCLILYPGLAAAALSLARQAWKKRR